MSKKEQKFKERIDEILENDKEYGGVLNTEMDDLKKDKKGKPMSLQQIVFLVERFYNRGLELDFDRKGDLGRQIKLLLSHLETITGRELFDPRMIHAVEERLEDRGNVMTEDEIDKREEKIITLGKKEDIAEEKEEKALIKKGKKTKKNDR